MPKNQNLNNKRVNFNHVNDTESISFQIDDNYYPSGENYESAEYNYDKRNNNKPLTYDDMLASMCMRVQNGNLCMIKDDYIPPNDYAVEPPQSLNRQQQIPQRQQQIPRPASNISANTMNNNSYIYNKYFQKYKQNDQPMDDVSELRNLLLSGQISREDYKKAVLIKLINDRNEKLRLQKIKSKKLLFSNSNINISGANRGQAPANMNKLFRFAGPGPLPYNQPRVVRNENPNNLPNTNNK
jgi:hypothetical protein